ncbi:hypothetical protein QQX98_007795 [Neonectria punicea]|uniref:Aminoglycoside phosphotransferase domain-containing protein n=1 Tax=Neonectria punicea TaxID=979145 RepID=A0ABR1GWZ2_9HYPO
MVDVLLQLSKFKLAAIGSLGFQDDEDDPEITKRPLSLNIAQLGNFGRVPYFELPSTTTTFTSSSKYYSALANMYLQQRSFQRNQAVHSADDCRKKYIARQLFRKLASEPRLADSEFDLGLFKLWCDDLRPANVLVDKDHKIAAVIDWELTYATRADPPLWLLFKAPEDWEAGLDDWAAKYEPILATFLRALEGKEKEFIEQGLLKESEILSTRMRESWGSGRFWLTKSESGDFKERLKLLSPDQVDAMEEFVKRKLEEKEEFSDSIGVNHRDAYTGMVNRLNGAC